MTQQPGQWGPPGGFPPQQPPPGWQPPPGYPPPGGYAGGFPPAPAPAYASPQPPGPGKSRGIIIGIVVAAVVFLVAVGGIVMVLTRDGGSVPTVSITPGPQPEPTELPTAQPTTPPSKQPSGPASRPPPSQSPQHPSGKAVDLGNGISLTPADGWSVASATKGRAQLTNGQEMFLGQAVRGDPDTNPGQLCTAWHKKVTDSISGGRLQDPESVDVGTTKLKAASCQAEATVSTGQGSASIVLFSLVSVRPSDGVTVVATVYFQRSSDQDQLDKDFSAMTNSMLRTQVQ